MSSPAFLDISARISDPTDDHRLFGFPEDAAAATALLQDLVPAEGAGAAVIAPPIYYTLAAGAEDVRTVNDFILAQAAARPAVVGAFGVVEPRHLAEAHVELGRIAQAGALGVVFSPRAHGLLADDALLVEACRAAHAGGLRCMIQAHPYSANESLDRIRRLARACPEIPFLVTGALMSWESGQSILGGQTEPNLHYEIGGLVDGVSFPRLFDAVGEDRLLYGSGGRERTDRQFRRWSERLRDADLPTHVREKFLWGNAARWLQLGFDGGCS